VHGEQLAPALKLADHTWFLKSKELGWDLAAAVSSLRTRVSFAGTVDELVKGLVARAAPGDQVLVMSNGGFGGLHDKLLTGLRAQENTRAQEKK
jgi:UDP-N-acetylmuramate: L-alanyl-gamma-D-glutamyl-meso-diaminopimelate ligase